MRLLTVIPLQKSAFKEELTYFSSTKTPDGSIVSITIRNKKILGLVVNSVDASTAKSDIKKMDYNLKKIVETKTTSIFSLEYIEAIIQTSIYFATNKSRVMSYLIPNILKENYDAISKTFLKIKKPIKKESTDTSNIKTEKLVFQALFEERISYYKTLIRESFASKKSIFLVLPTERDIEKFQKLLDKGIEDFVIPVHSGLTSKKALENINKILSTEHPVLILGTAPYLSLQRHDINTIIVEHENSIGYKTISSPYFDLRTFVEIYAVLTKTRVIFGDTLLRFETIGRQETGELSALKPISTRITFSGEMNIIEKNKKSDSPQAEKEKFKILTDESIKKIKETISKKENVFIFSLRKGLATCTICKSCGHEVNCDVCMAPVVLYVSKNGNKRMFVCNKCNLEKDPLMKCEYCDSWNLMPLGIGTDTVYQEIKKQFPKENILKLDREIAKTAKTAKGIVKEYESNPGSILIGTEMALTFLKEKVSLSVIASFDSLWSIPNYKISEKILQIVLNLIEKTENTLFLETKNINDAVINAIKNTNLTSYIREELEDRQKLGYPPYKRFIKVSYLGDKETTIRTRKILAQLFEEYNPHIFGGFITQIKGKYTTNMLIKIDVNEWSLPIIYANREIKKDLLEKLNSLPLEFKIQVDPEDLL